MQKRLSGGSNLFGALSSAPNKSASLRQAFLLPSISKHFFQKKKGTCEYAYVYVNAPAAAPEEKKNARVPSFSLWEANAPAAAPPAAKFKPPFPPLDS